MVDYEEQKDRIGEGIDNTLSVAERRAMYDAGLTSKNPLKNTAVDISPRRRNSA